MAITNPEVQITWPTAANNKSVAAGATEASEVFTPDATCFESVLTLKADNNGTPASGDVVTFYLAATGGDPDGASTDEYPTDVADMDLLAIIDTFNNSDPGVRTVPLSFVPHKAKVVAVSGASSNGITVSATSRERRG